MGRLTPPEFLREVRRILAGTEPMLARVLSDAMLAAWLRGGAKIVEKLPEPPVPIHVELPDPFWERHPGPSGTPTGFHPGVAAPAEGRKATEQAEKQHSTGAGAGSSSLPPPPSPPPPGPPQEPQEEEHPIIRFPVIEHAAKQLAERKVLTRSKFDALDHQAKVFAFTVARVATEDSLEKIREALAEDVATGGTLADFEVAVAKAVGASALAPSHIETVYRTNVAQAYAEGQRTMLRHPLVRSEFPYVEFHAVHDARTRTSHLAMETSGIQGTNVYRADDPAILERWPPLSYNCRCIVIPITLEMAAARGIHEAVLWLESGIPPQQPTFVDPPSVPPSFSSGPPSAKRA